MAILAVTDRFRFPNESKVIMADFSLTEAAPSFIFCFCFDTPLVSRKL